MEWLALELVAEARRILILRPNIQGDLFWSVIEQKLQRPRSGVDLSIAFAPHKMRLTGDELEYSAPGAGERSDILLLAWPMDVDEPTVVGWAYHTTNVPPGTCSMRRGQAYPESRVLWRQCVLVPDLMKLAAQSVARRIGLPSPVSNHAFSRTPAEFTWLRNFCRGCYRWRQARCFQSISATFDCTWNMQYIFIKI